MIKQHRVNYKGMSKDIARDLQSEKYFDAQNIRILATDQKSSFAVTNEAGNELIFSIPVPVVVTDTTSIQYTVGGVVNSLKYSTETSVIPRCEIEENYVVSTNPTVVATSGTQTIIGTKELRDSALIITTDNAGFDCFWELMNLQDGNFSLVLRYMGNLGLSSNNPIQILYNYENSVIQKVYFVDGIHQLRYLNLRQSIANGDSRNLIDVSPSAIDTVSTFTLSQPKIVSIVSGGNHTSGMVQYAYGLYILNGAQTTISPLSIIKPIDRGDGLGGGDVNEVLGKSVNLEITNIDKKFTHVRIYSIKYTSLNQTPEILLIADREIDNFTSFTYTDDGGGGEPVTTAEFAFLGSSPIIPQHIVTKDNRLFPINIKQQIFNVDLDMRAYSFNAGGTCQVLNNPYLNSSNEVTGVVSPVSSSDYILPTNNDAINADYDTFKYQANGTTLGAEGKYIKVEILQGGLSESEAKNYRFLKDRELYRFGIKFYNRRGQTSDPIWVCDLVAPEGNLESLYNRLKVELKADFYTWLNTSSNFDTEDDKPVGYKILRADRTLTDQTIYSQGFINPMIANKISRDKMRTLVDRRNLVHSNDTDKLPSMTRMFETMKPFIKCQDYHDLAFKLDSVPPTDNSVSYMGEGYEYEGIKSPSSKDWRAQNLQCNRLMQFFSPEVLFRNYSIDSSYKLRVVGLIEQDYVANWSTETNPNNNQHSQNVKFINGITPATVGQSTPIVITGSAANLSDNGFFGPTDDDNNRATHQVYRSFNGTFHKANGQKEFEIYGTPEITEKGQDFTPYNNDFSLRYANHLKTMLIDDWDESDAANDNAKVQIRGCNTIGAKCITFAEGDDDSSFPVTSRLSIEDIHSRANTGATKGVLLAEFVRDDSIKYIGNIYGGLSYEAKSVAEFIEIGEFAEILTTSVTINSPGDTYVNTFTFTKMVKDDVDIQSQEYNIVSEIVSIKVETTVDLKNRNDLSLSSWDNRQQPKYDEYQNYNTVYSQAPTLLKSIDTGVKLKKLEEFDGRIIASKNKIPGEFIDSWTDFLENETKDLDGKYGPINAVVNAGDEIFCLQDTAVALISINPRVQVVGSDEVSLELGTGGILHDYKYISTTTGCLNKFGVISTGSEFYYVDLINKGIMAFQGGGIKRLSDLQGFHHELLNRMNYDDIIIDNPTQRKGVSLGYNAVNGDIYFTFLQSSDNFTLGYNEKIDAFVSYYGYTPSWYINKGSKMITSNPTNTSLWEHFKGTKNHFYGTHHKSSITLHVAPEGNEIILNGASYKLELTDVNGLELPKNGLTGVRVYNEYQDSGIVPLVLRQNVFKKFRNWKVNFPRQLSTRQRVRSSWGFVEFSLNNTAGNKLILHDITIFYTQH